MPATPQTGIRSIGRPRGGPIASEGSPFRFGDTLRGFNLTKRGLILTRGAASAWNESLVESPNVFWDPIEGRYGLVYVGYSGAPGSPSVASIGLAWSDDLETWTNDPGNPLFERTQVAGEPDQNGCSGPLIWYQDGVYHLFHIGLTATGYEGGTKRLCLATATSLAGPWTRHGAIISPSGSGWRSTAIWHPNIVQRGDDWYLFFNATGSVTERIGYATSNNLGVWTVDDVNSPVLSEGAGGQWDDQLVGDPYVYRVGDLWYMAYYGRDGSISRDGLAWTPDTDFPLGWTKFAGNPVLDIGAGGTYDAGGAGKPAIWITPTTYYHFYTAVSGSGQPEIGLALERFAPGAAADSSAAHEWLSNFFAENYPTSPATEDDEFDDTTGNSGTGNGLNARWAWRNQGGGSATFGKLGWLTLSCPAQASDNWRIIEQAEPSAPYTIEAVISLEGYRQHFAHAGIVLVDGTNGDFYLWGLVFEATNDLKLEVVRWNSVTSWNSTPFSVDVPDSANRIYLRVALSGTTYSFWASVDGIGWIRYHTLTDAVVATKVGLGVNEAINAGVTKLHADYFRKVA